MKYHFAGIVFLVLASNCVLSQETPAPAKAPEKVQEKPAEKPAAPKESDPAALAFLKTVDEVMYNYPAAGVHSITLKMKMGKNPMMPPDMQEKLKDMAIVYYWQEEPWMEAVDVVGLPDDMAPMKGQMMRGGAASMRHLAFPSRQQVAKRYVVSMSTEGDLTKLNFAPREGQKDFMEFSSWHDKLGKLVKTSGKDPMGRQQPETLVTLSPFGTKYVISEGKQTTQMGESTTKFEYGKQGEVCVLTKTVISSGMMELEIPVEVEINPKHDPAIFGASAPKKEEEKPH